MFEMQQVEAKVDVQTPFSPKGAPAEGFLTVDSVGSIRLEFDDPDLASLVWSLINDQTFEGFLVGAKVKEKDTDVPR